MRQHHLSVINTILILNGYFMLAIHRSQRGTFPDTDWKKVTLPRPFNEDEAFRLSIEQLTDTVMWYRKHFRLPADSKNKKSLLNLKGFVKELIFISMANISACMKMVRWL